ncbi:Ribose 5-phosphate isomerase B [Bacillus badius]|uniref:Ribose 5-phosphate isomerase B n=1 Tax=Bacillus badius TaxID=1455 RepID=A0ABR5AYS7_BACBA|nr:Ribose 5-phosphate isomerase B [Bacillus badius]
MSALLIGTEGAQTPAGSAGQVRPRRRFGGEKAHCPPRGKRSAWDGNQQSSSASKIKSTAGFSFSRLIGHEDLIFKQTGLYG